MRLSRTQYAHYKLNVEEIMDRYNWANIANGVELRPGSVASAQISLPANSRNSVATQLRDWDRRDSSLKEFLLLSLPTEWKSTFMNTTGGGHELWQAIVTEFERETPDSHTQLMAALYNIIQGANESLDSYVERLQTITHQLEELGETVSTNTKVMCFFKGLNIRYKPEDVNILLEQQLSLEQAAQLVAEFAECKRDAFVRSHSRSNPPAVEVDNLIDLSTSPSTSATNILATPAPAPVPPVKTAKNAAGKHNVGVLIDVNSPASSSTSSTTSPNSTHRPYPAVPIITASPTSSTSSTPSAAQHRTAFEVTSLHRGLKNETGENNCFLNVTIQALWHLGPFRAHLTSYIHERQQQGTSKVKSKNVQSKGAAAVGLLDALCNLFVQYEFSDQSALPPTELRECLMSVSADFKLGEIADANEALDAILQRIHAEQSSTCPHAYKCLSHEVFGGNIMEQTICSRCGASSEPTLRSDFILTFQAAELLLEAKALFAKFSQFENEETVIHPTENHTIVGKIQHFNPVGGLSRFLGCARRHAYRNNPENSPVKRGSTVNSAIHHDTQAAHHYGNTEFGHILSKCMTLHQRSCPSLEFGNTSPPLQSRVALLDRQGSQENRKLFALDNCGGKASVLQYSLDPPLAVALSIGTYACTMCVYVCVYCCVIYVLLSCNPAFMSVSVPQRMMMQNFHCIGVSTCKNIIN